MNNDNKQTEIKDTPLTAEDLVVGNKYVPIKKSNGVILSKCEEWKAAKEDGQNFLYYIGEDGNNHHFAHIPKQAIISSNYYLPSDVIPYVEPEQRKEESEAHVSNDIPLWRTLNAERTQGECISANNGTALLQKGNNRWHKIAAFEHDATTQYTALAVNNLHKIADALEQLHSLVMRSSDKLIFDNGENAEIVAKAKDALNSIS